MTESAKKRVSSLAKQYEISGDTLVRLLVEAGVEVKSTSSMIDQPSFMKVKPLIVAEKEKQERDDLVKAGKKIPMRAVLKKAPIVPPTPAAAPEPALDGPEPPAAVAPSETETEAPVEPVVNLPPPVEPAPVAVPEAPAPPRPVTTPAEAEAKARELHSELKVSVEKPDAALLARIAKTQAENTARFRSREEREQGYSGHLHRVAPGGPGRGSPGREGGLGRSGPFTPRGPGTFRPSTPGTGPGNRTGSAPGGGFGARSPRPDRPSGERSFEPPKDIYALRAQEAGVVNTGWTDRDKEKEKERARTEGGHTPQRRGGGGHRRKSREQIEQELLAARNNVSKVMASLSRSPGAKGRLKNHKEEGEEEGSEEKKQLTVSEFVTIGELAGLMNVLPAQVIAKCMELGLMVTINQRLDHEIIALVADEFGYEAQLMDEYAQETAAAGETDDGEGGTRRAPIITVMGHVDHGKTSILDYIRKTNVIAGEAGGITQHIGAHLVDTIHGPICFLDTPGHEAFSAMRARGANVTDVVLLVVAADSMVMPQTREAIQLAKNANCQIVVAINKIDLPTANPDKIRTQLAENGVEVEQWGGKYPCLEISAKAGTGMDKLLETLALESEILDLKAHSERPASGTVLESRLDKGKGAVASVLVQNGTLRVGDPFVTGVFAGKVRSLLDERGNPRNEVGPSTPVQVLGLEGTPQAGDSFMVVGDEREAREIAGRRRMAAKDRELRQKRHITLDQLYDQIKSGEFHELKVIIKGDVDGSVEAIATALERLSTKEVRVLVIHKGVGAVRDADVHLAAASEALIIAFHVLPSESVRELAEQEGVTINSYRIIYEVVDEIKAAMEGMLQPELREEVAGEAQILKLFRIPKVGTVAGCKVQSGLVERDLKARLYRGGIEVGEAKVVSLKREKDDAKSVKAGMECGIGLEGLKDIQEGDVLAFFRKVEVARKLTPVNA